MKFDNIALPVDFSEASLAAVRWACAFARKHNSQIHLVHVYEHRYYSVASEGGGLSYAVDAQADATLRDEIMNEMKKISEMPEAAGLKLYAQLVSDRPVWRFFEGLDKKNIDLIIMGTRGVTGLMHGGLVGTNTERVIRHSHLPVLSIPLASQYKDTATILFATDFQDPLNDVYPAVVGLAKANGAAIKIAVINTRNNFATSRYAYEQYQSLTKAFPYDKTELVVHNDDSVEEGIQTLSHQLNADVIAMLTHGRTGIAHLLRGSIAEDISSSLSTPLLTLKAQKA